MNILIVDDKYEVVQGIKEGVDWDRLGDITLFEAYSGLEALQCFKENEIDLLVTDIEMPGISGIDLAERVTRDYPDAGIVFLSSHDSFRFAQAAIRMRCYDYILQPVDHKTLRLSIEEGLEQLKQNRRLLPERDADGESRPATACLSREDAWRRVILSKLGGGKEEIASTLKKAGLEADFSTKYRIVLICLSWIADPMQGHRNREKDEFVSNMKNSLAQNLPLAHWVPLLDNRWILLFEETDIIPYLQLLVGSSENGRVYKLVAYVSEQTDLEHLKEDYGKILELARNNVSGYAGVYEYRELGSKISDSARVSERLAVHKWRGWLLEGKEELIREEVSHYLSEKESQKALDRHTLILIVQLLSCAFYNYDDKQMQEIMSSPDVLKLYEASIDSKEAMAAYVERIVSLHKERRLAHDADTGKALVKRIKNYVNTHIGNRLSREEISAAFFISKDYVSHLFRKYENQGFTQYVNERKMEKARELLLKTNLPVNVIASSVGISEYSYFSKMFKDYSGMSANELRAKVRGT